MKVILFTKEELEEIIKEATEKAFQSIKEKSEKNKPKNQFITLEEASTLLKVSKQTVRNYITRGDVKSKKIGRRLLICKESIDKSLEEVKSLKYKR